MGCNNSKPAVAKGAHGGGEETRTVPASGAASSEAPRVRKLKELSESSGDRRRQQNMLQNLVHEEYQREIGEVYELGNGEMLGKGGFGTVQVVEHKQTKKKFALKAIELSRVKDTKSFNFFMKEVEVMKHLDHPNIVRLQEVYQTPDYLFLVMDLYSGGDLLTSYRFSSEAEAASVVRKVVNAIRYCHDQHIAHRDLKLDNILLEDSKAGGEIKLVDFGLSSHFGDQILHHDVVGTWVYMAPEVINGSHFPTSCDMWSIGVISYLLLCGYPPFQGGSTKELKWQIQHGTYQFHTSAWSIISPVAQNFIKRLLVRNPQERMSASEAQHHPWLSDTGALDVSDGPLDGAAVKNLTAFRNANFLTKLTMEVVARTLDVEQIKALESEFIKMDSDGNGKLSYDELKETLQKNENISDAEVWEIFASVDVDGQGEIYFNDFLAASLGRRELDERRLRLAFDRLDYDHNGAIDASDLQLMLGRDMDKGEVDNIMAEFDLNNDGTIDFNEFCLAVRKADEASRRSSSLLSLATMRSASMPHLFADASHVQQITAALADDQSGDGKEAADDEEKEEDDEGLPPSYHSSTFDSDTPPDARVGLRERAQLGRAASGLAIRRRRATLDGASVDSDTLAKVALMEPLAAAPYAGQGEDTEPGMSLTLEGPAVAV